MRIPNTVKTDKYANHFPELYLKKEITRLDGPGKSLFKSDNQFNIIWENSPDGMRLVNNQGYIVAVNNAYCKLVEKSEEELIGKNLQSAYHNYLGVEPEKLYSHFEKLFNEKKIKASFETKIKLHSGKIRYIEVFNTFISSADTGHVYNEEYLLFSVFRDITKQKEAQQTKKLLAEIVDSCNDAIIGNSLNGIITSWNSGAEKIFGYTKDEVKGLSVSFLFSPLRNDEIRSILERIKSGEKIDDYETICVTKLGKPINISATVSPIEDNFGLIFGVSIIARDVTEKKLIEQTLRESEERYRSLVETSPDAIILMNFTGKIIMGNRLAMRLLGFTSVDEIMGRSIFRHIQKKDYGRVISDAKIILDAGVLKNSEYYLLNKSAKLIPFEISASIILDNLGVPVAVIAVIRDISERKISEEALHNSELQFRSVWENSNDGMRLSDEEGNIIAVNNAFCNLVGMNEKALVGKPFHIIYGRKETGYAEENLKSYKKNFSERSFQTHKQSKTTFSCGKTVDLDVTYSIIEPAAPADRNEKGKPLLLAIFHDITERKKVEEELRNSEKHAAIGKMAAYLSHEIKTPLASIKMNIDMLSKSLEIPKDKQKSFAIIQKEIKRLNNLLKNVLQFSRQVDLVFVNINLFSLVNQINDFLMPVLQEKGIKFINNVHHAVIKGDYQKLHSVLLHMIENSFEAISGDGIIEIYSTLNQKNNSISIFIRDSGAGVSMISQIFDPFFTTKASGTGLGLSIAHKMIEQHNGKIKLLSTRPGETIFEINFPNNLVANGKNNNN